MKICPHGHGPKSGELCNECYALLVNYPEEEQEGPYVAYGDEKCPGCEYDLKHGFQPECPGCGHELRWLY